MSDVRRFYFVDQIFCYFKKVFLCFFRKRKSATQNQHNFNIKKLCDSFDVFVLKRLENLSKMNFACDILPFPKQQNCYATHLQSFFRTKPNKPQNFWIFKISYIRIIWKKLLWRNSRNFTLQIPWNHAFTFKPTNKLHKVLNIPLKQAENVYKIANIFYYFA